jgi:hypothetical protein
VGRVAGYVVLLDLEVNKRFHIELGNVDSGFRLDGTSHEAR